MAVAQQYSFLYRIRWGQPPQVTLSGEFGVGLDPRISVEGDFLVLRPRSGNWGYRELRVRLPADVQQGDEFRLETTPLDAHRSFGWWRWGKLVVHLGHLVSLSGTCLGGRLVEVVNEHDQDGCLALYQRQLQLRLRPGERAQLGEYQIFLQSLGGSVTGRSYRADGWVGQQSFQPEQLQAWSSLFLPEGSA